jgi:hypothetical protein
LSGNGTLAPANATSDQRRQFGAAKDPNPTPALHQGKVSGWIVTGELQGWQFRLTVIPAGLRISANAQGGAPAVWVVKVAGKVAGGG